MEEKRIDFHHLESESVYGETLQQRPLIPLPKDEASNVSTPRYDVPQFGLVGQKGSEMVYGGLLTFPKPFNEPMEPLTWLNEFEDTADGYSWDDEMKFKKVFSCLEGASKQWYSNEKRTDPDFNWIKFKKGLLKNFRNTCNPLFSDEIIQERVMSEEETLNSYWQDKINLISIYYPEMPVRSQISALFRGLEPELRKKIKDKYIEKTPTKLKDMYEMAKKSWDAMTIDVGVIKSDQKKNKAQKDMENHNKQLGKKIEKIDQELTQLKKENSRLKQVTFGPNTKSDKDKGNKPMDLSKVECYFCHEYGHYANRCPKKENANQTKNYLRQN